MVDVDGSGADRSDPSDSSAPRPQEVRAGPVGWEQLGRWAHFLSLVAAFVALLVLARRQWFVQDDWVFAARSSEGGAGGLFRPYVVHWMTWSLLLFRVEFAVFALRSYLPYLVPVIALHVLCGHLLWRLLLQVGARVWVATALVGVFLLGRNAVVVSLLAVQTSGTAALAAGLGVLLLVNTTEPDRRRYLAATGLATLSLATWSLAPVMVAVAGLVAAFRHGLKNAVRLVAVPTLVYLLWVLGAAATGNADRGELGTRADILSVSRFVWSGLVATFDQLTGFEGPGAVLVVALGAWMWWRRDRRATAAAPALAMALGAIGFLGITALGRVDPFLATGSIPGRYVYCTWPLVLPAVGLALSALTARFQRQDLVAVALVAVLAVHGLRGVIDEAHAEAARAAGLRRLVFSSAEVVSREPYLPDVLIDQESAPSLTASRLARYQERGYLPDRPSEPEGDYLGAALALQARVVSTVPEAAVTAPDIETVVNATQEVVGSCTSIRPDGRGRPEVGLAVVAHSALRLQSRTGGTVTIVRHSADDPDRVAVRDYLLDASGTAVLELLPARGGWSLILPADGVTALCAPAGQ